MIDTRSGATGPCPAPSRPAWVLAGLYLFGIGFGFVEAAVVVDLRAILGPSVGRLAGRSSDDLFPMIPLDRLIAGGPDRRAVDAGRGPARGRDAGHAGRSRDWRPGRSFVGRFAAFIAGFGVWDLTYYLFLKLLIGWPASVWTWDVLFLIPVPWAAPVLAPAIRGRDDGPGGLDRDRRGSEGPAVPGLAMGLAGDRRGRTRS